MLGLIGKTNARGLFLFCRIILPNFSIATNSSTVYNRVGGIFVWAAILDIPDPDPWLKYDRVKSFPNKTCDEMIQRLHAAQFSSTELEVITLRESS